MDEEQFARNVMHRLVGSRAIKLPEMTEDDYIIWLDSERLPERIAWLKIMDRPDRPINGNMRDHLDWCLETLNVLKEVHDAGELSDEDYERLTTPQNYDGDHLYELKQHTRRFIPHEFGIDGEKRVMYTLITEQGEIVITPKNGQWVLYDLPPTHN